MKIIISSKEFAKQLENAIKENCTSININSLQKRIIYNCNSTFSDIVHICNSNESSNFDYPFEPLKAFKIIQFLNMLNEQPIVVDIDFYSIEEIDIEITQTIFKV